ncbi:DUF317 domain-containing protein [Streptomyces sp. SID1121]|uniref:DUF317 domain-containing protein n=1 Tax=Streptomyces sp. SID1121 TaxID=3425888 RepID=UPI004055B780
MSVPPGPETVEVHFITPRHLAGGGDPAWVTVPLHRACGWSYGNDPLMPRVLLSSPDQKALLRLEPKPDGQWWILHHAAGADRPAWDATFGAHTPVELIAAFADALTHPASAATASSDPYEALQQIGRSAVSYGGNGFVSPDRTVFVKHSRDEPDPSPTVVSVGLGPARPVWQATFDVHTPRHLIAAFIAGFTDPHPVLRTGSLRGLPTRNPNFVTRQSVDIRALFVAAALEERVTSLAGRRAGTPPPGLGPPCQPPAKNSRDR